MTQVLLHIEPDMYREVWEHLLSQDQVTESAGFMFVNPELHGDVPDIRAHRMVPGSY